MTKAMIQKRYRIKHQEKERAADRDRKRRVAGKVRAQKERQTETATAVFDAIPEAEDPASALFAWCRDKLKVPPGHPRAGQPFVIPEFGKHFSETCWTLRRPRRFSASLERTGNLQSWPSCYWPHLAEGAPLRRRGWRAGVVSLNREKAGELARQMEAIAGASRLRGLKFLSHPRLSIKSAWGEVSILPADRASGAASGFDLSICDEIGLLQERDRELLAGMRSAVSAKGGKFLSLSVRGSGPFIPEILARDGAPGLKIHLYESPPNCALDDEAAWLAKQPWLGDSQAI